MHVYMISYLVLYFLWDLYDESQARVGALERQLAALQVVDDDEEEEADENEDEAVEDADEGDAAGGSDNEE